MMKRYMIYLLFVLSICSCCLEFIVPDENSKEELIEFAAAKMRVITKSGDEAVAFDDGTVYKLFAVPSSSDESRWLNTVLYDRKAVEAGGKVDYGEKVAYGVGETSVLDFYGLTYGTDSPVDVIGAEGQIPSVSVSIDEQGALPDLMYSDNLKAKNSASGLLTMEFRHALSRISFEIVRQSESEDDVKQLSDVVLKRISIEGSHVEGVFDVEQGVWQLADDDIAGRVFSDSGTDAFEISETVADVPGQMLMIPNNGLVTVVVELDGLPEGSSNRVECPLVLPEKDDSSSNPLLFEQNCEYKLTITVLKNDVRVVTVVPQKYEWIDIDLTDSSDPVVYLGQPIYFGGLMWMDRNLGATSADCENDWYKTVGYYYQFGRNIPFILDVEKWLAYTQDDGVKDLKAHRIIRETTDRIGKLYPSWNTMDDEARSEVLKNMVECIYSIDHKGNRVYGYKTVTNQDDQLIRKVGDVIYGEDGKVDDELTSINYRYGSNTQVWTYRDSRASEYWQSVEDQPCPKGWRLPTQEDLYSFMPRGQRVNWNTYKYPAKLNSANATYNTGTYGYIDGPDGRYNVCYMIKNPGTDNAYRIMIKSHFAKNPGGQTYSKNKRYITITRFAASKNDNIDDYTSSTYEEAIEVDSKENTMWNNPIETAAFPGCGYFVPDSNLPDLRSFGWGTIMRTSDPTRTSSGSDNSSNWVQYLSVTDFQLSIESGSRRALGDQIRCVRDINAK